MGGNGTGLGFGVRYIRWLIFLGRQVGVFGGRQVGAGCLAGDVTRSQPGGEPIGSEDGGPGARAGEFVQVDQ